MTAICEGLTRQGMITLRIDLTNNRGEADGVFDKMTLTGEVEDAEDALNYLLNHADVDTARIGVSGHSFGGLVAALLAVRDRRIRAVAPLSPVFDMRQRLQEVLGADGLARWREQGYRDLGGGMRQGYQFWEDLQRWEITKEVSQIRVPFLVVMGDGTNELPLAHGEAYLAHIAGNNKRLEIVKGADHTYTDSAHLHQVVSVTAAWFAQVLA